MAESVFHDLVNRTGLNGSFHLESAGTANYHVGEKPDQRTLDVLHEHGIEFYSRARRVTRDDFVNFDYLLAMDHSNLLDLQSIEPKNSIARLDLFRKYDNDFGNGVVPDPYYGSTEGFNEVYNIVKRCSIGFLEHLSTAS